MAEYLSEEEQLAALRSFWQRYGWLIVVAFVLVIGGYVGWSYYKDSQVRRAQAASDLYEQYQENLADEAVSNSLAQQLDTEFAGTSYHVFSLLTRATAKVEAGEFEAAAELLQQATQSGADQQMVDVANLRLARVQQQLGDSDAALAALGATRGEGYRSVVAELKGDIHLARDERELALEAYSAAMETAPEANSRPLLKIKLAQLQVPN